MDFAWRNIFYLKNKEREKQQQQLTVGRGLFLFGCSCQLHGSFMVGIVPQQIN